MDLSGYETLIRITEFVPQESCNDDYLVENINGTSYRIAYRTTQENQVIYLVNAVLLAMMFITVAVFVYVYHKVLKPFQAMSNLSHELAKEICPRLLRKRKASFWTFPLGHGYVARKVGGQ